MQRGTHVGAKGKPKGSCFLCFLCCCCFWGGLGGGGLRRSSPKKHDACLDGGWKGAVAELVVSIFPPGSLSEQPGVLVRDMVDPPVLTRACAKFETSRGTVHMSNVGEKALEVLEVESTPVRPPPHHPLLLHPAPLPPQRTPTPPQPATHPHPNPQATPTPTHKPPKVNQ